MLSLQQLQQLLIDVLGDCSSVARVFHSTPTNQNEWTFKQLYSLFCDEGNTLATNSDHLFRLSVPYSAAKKCLQVNQKIDYIGSLMSIKQESLQSTKSVTRKSSSERETYCKNHGSKKYEYGLHAVTMDSTGRIVDPRIICDSKICFVCSRADILLSLSPGRLDHSVVGT